MVEINIWFSSGGTKSLLHVDTYENILTLVDGTKQLVLYAPEEVANLHPYEAKVRNKQRENERDGERKVHDDVVFVDLRDGTCGCGRSGPGQVP